MNIQTVSGHLTANNKKAIKAIFDAGLTEGKVGRSSYYLTCENDLHTVEVFTKDRGLAPVPGSKLRVSKYTHTFKIK